MKIYSLTVLFTGILLLSCGGKGDSPANQMEATISKTDSLSHSSPPESFKIDKALVKKRFMEYLPSFSEGRKLSTYIIMVSDLNGDNLLDGVVDYGLEPTYEDNGGGGNAIGEFPGLVVFLNTGKTNRTKISEKIYPSRVSWMETANTP